MHSRSCSARSRRGTPPARRSTPCRTRRTGPAARARRRAGPKRSSARSRRRVHAPARRRRVQQQRSPRSRCRRRRRRRCRQGRPLEACAVQRLVAPLEQQPLLRVHRLRLGGRHAETRVVEQLRAVHKRAVPHAPRNLAVGGARRLKRPTLDGHLRHEVGGARPNAAQRRRRCDTRRQHHLQPARAHRVA